jgi:hypothetical protein
MKRAFDELGINTASKANGGPNQCIQLDHRDGAKVVRDKDNKLPPIDKQKYVDESYGKEYRVSQQDTTTIFLSANRTTGNWRHVSIWHQRPRRLSRAHQRDQPSVQCESPLAAQTHIGRAPADPLDFRRCIGLLESRG